MYKWIRIALFALPLAGGAALAQGSGTSGSAGAPGSVNPPPVTNDTRTPMQEKAGRIDDTSPALPGDATKPAGVPNTVPESNRNGMPDTTGMSDTTGMTTPGSQSTDKKVHKRKGVEEKSAQPKVDESTLPRRSDTTRDNSGLRDSTKTNGKLDRDTTRDQLDSDK